MVRRSQNLWPVLTKDETYVVRVGGGAYRVAPSCAPVFAAFMARFDAVVEDLSGPVLDDWSWADRLVRGSTTSISNHASGTAVDLNALRHGRGSRNTFTAAQLARLRKLLAAFPVLRWGGDFSTTVDEMHFEVNVSAVELARFAARTHPTPAPEDDMPLTDLIHYGAGNAAITGASTATVEAAIAMASARALDASRQSQAAVQRLVAQAETLNTLTEHVDALSRQVSALQAAVTALAPTPPG